MSTLDALSIRDAALELVTLEGPTKLTMRRLAERLGVEASSLYHHVPNKGALVDAVVDAVVAQATPPPADLAWPEQLGAAAAGWRDLLAAHAHAVALFGSRPSRALALVDSCPAMVAAMVAAGVSEADAKGVVSTLVLIVVGQAEVNDKGDVADPAGWHDQAVALVIRGAQAGLVRPVEETVATQPAPVPEPVAAAPKPAAPAATPAPAVRPVSTPRPAPAPEPAPRGLGGRLLRRVGGLLGGDED